MQDLSGTTIKGYELKERIGTGGMGAVYRAYQSTVGREVAIKIILPGYANQPDFIRRFEAEAQLVARLEHMNIVPLYDYWREPNGAYLVMRYLRGGSLKDMLIGGPCDLESTAHLLDQVASALTVAHRSNVIHRDIKPANILLDEDGNAYLTDFGIAKELGQDDGHMTDPNGLVGSPDYLSPEQARADPVSPQTDIYCLGVVVYEMLTGQHPFPGRSPVERLFAHINDPLPEIKNIDDSVRGDINQVITRATAKDPLRRYPDVMALALAFREAAALSISRVEPSLVELLTPREQEVLNLLIEGKSNREIAEKLIIELSTVKWHVNQLYKKLNVRSRVQAIVKARELNLIIEGFERADTTTTLSSLPEPENPYKGLQAFTAADEQDFFGRERMTRKLLKRLGQKDKYARFLAVVGPSGSGKSSLVRAGLIPALWRGELNGSDSWYVVDMLPGTRPMDELEVALMRIASDQSLNLAEQLARDQSGLLRAASLILPDDGSELLVVVDQFEEVFTLIEDEQQRQHFLDLLHAAVTDPRSRVRVVVTLRADFYDRPLQYPQFGELVRDRMETVLPLGAEELEQAIVKPAERVGVKYEEGLVPVIIEDVHYQPGALPLLQYALTELFEQRENHTLTHKGYQQIGRAVGALAARAEETYSEFDLGAQETIRQMFLRLVTLGEGVEDTRRRVPRSELLAIADNPDLMDEVVDTYAAYRLLSLDHDPSTRRPTVEVAHEALLREWERLREWLNEGRADIRMQRQLARAAGEWHEAEQDPSFLLRGARLDQFEGWSAITTLALTGQEHDYLQASIALREERAAAEVERQAHEAKLEQRARRVLQVLVGVFLVAALISGGLALWANSQRKEAEAAREAEAEARQDALRQASVGLAGQAQLEIERHNPEIAVLLAMEALEEYPYTWQAEKALGYAIQQSRTKHILSGHLEDVENAAWSPDGTRIATAGIDGLVKIWDAQTGEELLTTALIPLEDYDWGFDLFWDVTWSPDNTRIVTASADLGTMEDIKNVARVWDADTGEILLVLSGHEEGIVSATWSPDGTRILTSSIDGTARVWDSETGAEDLVVTTDESGFYPDWGWDYGFGQAAWSPDGSRFVTAGGDGMAQVWDAATGRELMNLTGDPSGLYGVAWSPGGERIATGGLSGKVDLWDANTGEKILTLSGHSDVVNVIAWSPDGTYLATASNDDTAKIWDADTGLEILTLTGHDNYVYGVSWSPDGKQIATASADFTARVWDVYGEVERLTLPIRDNHCTAMAPDGTRVAGCYGTTTEVWDINTSTRLLTLSTPDGEMSSVDWSPDGLQIATASDKVITIWDAGTGAQLRTLVGHTAPIGRYIRWSENGKWLATSSLDGIVKVWDVQTGQEIHTFRDYEGPEGRGRALVLFWSPSGEQIGGVYPREGRATVWDVNTGESLTFDMESYMNSMAWSPDGKYMATAGLAGVWLWDAATAEFQSILFDESWTNHVVWSQDGTRIVTASDDGIGRVWDVATGEPILSLYSQESASGLWRAIYSPDEALIATCNSDATITIWDATTGATRFVLYGHSYAAFTFEWSQDSTTILTGSSQDLTARVWRIWQTRQEMIDHARECCVLRQLTPEEREMYGLPPLDEEQPSGQETSRSPVNFYATSFVAFGLGSVGLVVAGRRLKR